MAGPVTADPPEAAPAEEKKYHAEFWLFPDPAYGDFEWVKLAMMSDDTVVYEFQPDIRRKAKEIPFWDAVPGSRRRVRFRFVSTRDDRFRYTFTLSVKHLFEWRYAPYDMTLTATLGKGEAYEGEFYFAQRDCSMRADLTLAAEPVPLTERVFEWVSSQIAGAINQGMTTAFNKQIGMPFADRLGIGEGMAADAKEVVKKGSPAIRKGYEDALGDIRTEILGAIDAEIEALEKAHSPITPDEAWKSGTDLSAKALVWYIDLSAIGSAIEAGTLGQVEIPGHFLIQLASIYGLYKFVGTPIIMLYDTAISRPLQYYYNEKFRPAIPSERDIIEMYSRGKILDTEAHTLMSYHGYAKKYDAWWDELRKTPLRYFALNAIARAGFYDEDLFKDELDRSGYSEEAKEYLKKAFKNTEVTTEIREAFGSLRKLMKEGFVTKAQAKQMFEQYRAIEDPVDRALLVGEWEAEYDEKSDKRSLILEQFRKGAITRVQATAELIKIMPEAGRIATLLNREELRIKVKKIPTVVGVEV
jgi:hypothetical protein